LKNLKKKFLKNYIFLGREILRSEKQFSKIILLAFTRAILEKR